MRQRLIIVATKQIMKTNSKVILKYVKTSYGSKEVYEETAINFYGWRERREVIKWAVDRLAEYRGHTRPPQISIVMKVNGKVYKTYNRDLLAERIAKRLARRK